MLDRIEFLVGEAAIAMRRNGLLTLAAITTVAISLFLIGGFGVVYAQAYRYINTLPAQLDVRVFVKDGTSSDDVTGLGDTMRKLPGVAGVTFIPKAEAWAKMRLAHPEIPADLDNPLPDGYNLTFQTVQAADSAATSLGQEEIVDKVVYQKELLQVLRQALRLFRYVGYFGLLLFVIGGIIIFNAIQLTVVARRIEIRIMQLVGASNFTIRVPFMIEGFLQGVLGALLASAMLAAVGAALRQYVQSLGLSMYRMPIGSVTLALVCIGAVLGLLCSNIAVRVPLKFR